MAKMWAGRTDGVTSRIADDFNSSIRFDSRMYRQDITGSMAHAAMLGARGIISQDDAKALIERINSRHGLHIIEHAAAIGLGSREYELVKID